MSYKVVAKSAIEIVAEFGPYDTLEDAKADAQELADKMEEREDVDVYVLPPEAQAELGLEGPVAAFEGPELVIEEGGFSRAPLLNPHGRPEPLPYGHTRRPQRQFIEKIYTWDVGGPTLLFSAAWPGPLGFKEIFAAQKAMEDHGIDFDGLDWTTSGTGKKTLDGYSFAVQLQQEFGPYQAGPVDKLGLRYRNPNPVRRPGVTRPFYELEGGSLDEAIATAEYVVKDATEAGQLAFSMGDTEGAGKYVRQVEKAKRDLSKLQAARHSVGHRSYLGSTEGRGRYGAERRWRQRMGREAAEVIAAQRAGGRYVNPERGPSASGANWNRLSWGWLYDNENDGVAFKVTEKPGPGIPLYTLTALTDQGVFKHKEPYQWKHPEDAFLAAKEWFPAMAGHTAFSDLTSNWLKLNPEQWLQEADEEIEEAGTEGAFTKQARRAGYKNTMQFARAVMKGWRSGKKTVLNKKTRKQQGITKKTMNRANFAINAQKRRRNPPKKNSFLTDDQFEAKYGVRPGDRFTDEHGEWVVDYAESYITDPPIVGIYRADRGKGHAISMGVSRLLDPHFFAHKRQRNPEPEHRFQVGDRVRFGEDEKWQTLFELESDTGYDEDELKELGLVGAFDNWRGTVTARGPFHRSHIEGGHLGPEYLKVESDPTTVKLVRHQKPMFLEDWQLESGY